jgi:ubiquinone/menaquinone biosynthesis C-methylase UbiE
VPESHAGQTADEAAAAEFEQLSPALWNPMGNALATAADLQPGDRVLDAGCGGGAATIPAAQLVVPNGCVDAVDLAGAPLAVGRAKAEALGLDTIRWTQADAAAWTAQQPYDAVLCGYSCYFFDRMDHAVAHLVRLLVPGGRLALSTWAGGAHEPFSSILHGLCAAASPGLADHLAPLRENIARLDSAAKLRGWLHSLGLEDIDVREVSLRVPLDGSMAWSMVLGTGYRRLLPDDPAALAELRRNFLAALGERHEFNADSLIAVGRTPAP